MNHRQQKIIDRVRAKGFVSIDDLAHDFSVTSQTIRRDINALQKRGMVRRYHGGAGLPSSVENVAYSARQVLYLEEKQRIGRLAARSIPDEASLFINIGTTTEEVAKALRTRKGLRVIANNLNIAMILSENESFEVIIAGGLVRNRDRGVVGEATIDFIRQFRVDYGIIGTSGIDSDGTMLDFDYREVRVARAIIDNSRKVYLVADHSKFGRNAMVRLGDLSEIDALFTDQMPPEHMLEVLERAEVELHVAEPPKVDLAHGKHKGDGRGAASL